MNLPKAPDAYETTDQDQIRSSIMQADKQNVKVGAVFEKILMRDTATGVIKTIKMTSGALVIS